jgi:hypothetical protein
VAGSRSVGVELSFGEIALRAFCVGAVPAFARAVARSVGLGRKGSRTAPALLMCVRVVLLLARVGTPGHRNPELIRHALQLSVCWSVCWYSTLASWNRRFDALAYSTAAHQPPPGPAALPQWTQSVRPSRWAALLPSLALVLILHWHHCCTW